MQFGTIVFAGRVKGVLEEQTDMNAPPQPEWGDDLADVRPGQLEMLKTKEEVFTRRELVDAYICSVPTRATRDIMTAIRTIPSQTPETLLHLRRVAKTGSIPSALEQYNSRPNSSSGSDASGRRRQQSRALIFLCATSLISKSDLERLLSDVYPFSGQCPPEIHVISVPKYPPTSSEHATALSKRYWPISYNNSNPFGPHPSLVARRTLEVATNAAQWMALAAKVGREAAGSGNGIGAAAVVVEKLADGLEQVVCVAGDARHANQAFRAGLGDPGRHAIMRAISLVAEKRRRHASNVDASQPLLDSSSSPFPPTEGRKLSPLEAKYFDAPDTISPNGYLCLNLLVFVTHEPCLCCTMALLHSRVGGVIFGEQMPSTGGMCAARGLEADEHYTWESGVAPRQAPPEQADRFLRYGLFWRDDLNWKFLAWQWKASDVDHSGAPKRNVPSLPMDLHV